MLGPPALRTSKPVALLPEKHDPAREKPPAPSAPSRQASRAEDARPGLIAAPDPLLLEPYAGDDGGKLPRIAADGRTPMKTYRAAFDPTYKGPRVGMVVAGIGMSEADSLMAVNDLPGSVTLAVSAYASSSEGLLEKLRRAGHEYLVSIPMEPQEYPINDPDDRRALMTSLPAAENRKRLLWLLSRQTGYVGATNAFGQMHGERLAAIGDEFGPVLAELGQRGILFVDARSGQPRSRLAWNRSVDVVIDNDPVDAAALDQRLDALTRAALDNGAALGLVQIPRPVTLSRVAAWTRNLAAKGVMLAPVSALALPPTKRESEN